MSRGRMVHRARTPKVDERALLRRTARPSSRGWSTTAAGASGAAAETLGRPARLVEPLLHHLAGAEDVGARLEDQLDRGQAGKRTADRIVSSHATPFRRSCSSGTVMSCSTSAADRPSASVWTSMLGGENSGRTSVGALRRCHTPPTSTTAPTATTSLRARTLDAISQRITGRTSPDGGAGARRSMLLPSLSAAAQQCRHRFATRCVEASTMSRMTVLARVATTRKRVAAPPAGQAIGHRCWARWARSTTVTAHRRVPSRQADDEGVSGRAAAANPGPGVCENLLRRW